MGNKKAFLTLFLSGIMCLLFLGCSTGTPQPEQTSFAPLASDSTNTVEIDDVEVLTPEDANFNYPLSHLTLPEKTAVIETSEHGGIDYGNAAKQGYVMAWIESEQRAKLRIEKTDGDSQQIFDYDINSEGRREVFPLTFGTGQYRVTLFEKQAGEGIRYSGVVKCEFETQMTEQEAEIKPYMYPTVYAYYTKDSQSVQLSRELSFGCNDDIDVVNNVYEYVKTNISYDEAKATAAGKRYTPNPDETLQTKTGICFDYASVVTALLRAQDIPTRLVIGRVSTEEGLRLHAWNEVLLQTPGTIDGSIEVPGGSWVRIDLTYAAALGAGRDLEQFVGDGSNYITEEIH